MPNQRPSLKLTGVPAAPGISDGPSFLYREQAITIPHYEIEDLDTELQRFEHALTTADVQIEKLRAKAESETGVDEAAIFDAHALFLQDPTLISAVQEAIHERKTNVEAAWMEAIEENAAKMEALEDEYFRARAMDIRDVGQRVLRILLDLTESDLSALKTPSIILARDLTPSDTVRIDKSLVLGFCTAEGGPTSHTAILAKALGLSAVVGLGPSILEIKNGTPILVDGEKGEIVVFPDGDTVTEFEARRRDAEIESETDKTMALEPAITKDGHQVEIVANIGSIEEAKKALSLGAEGVGLLRTEFLYLDRATAPSEDGQWKAYQSIMEIMGEHPVIVRTLDVGGDKEVPYLKMRKEANPFLGWRAIRMSLDQPKLFKTQLRALLRASPNHDLRIMFPMIATLRELRRARDLLQEAREEVIAAGHPIAEEIQVGIMVEIPSVVILADLFAREVDFFSIGTNDLTQYTMAAERTNEKVIHLGDACHPAILRQIGQIINVAHDQGIWVGLCGELASDPEAIPILLGMELDEFSMAPSSIPRAKAIIRKWSLKGAKKLAAQTIKFDSAEAVREKVKNSQPL
jgi:phosphoenolpyruvate-protein phosphotransferase